MLLDDESTFKGRRVHFLLQHTIILPIHFYSPLPLMSYVFNFRNWIPLLGLEVDLICRMSISQNNLMRLLQCLKVSSAYVRDTCQPTYLPTYLISFLLFFFIFFSSLSFSFFLSADEAALAVVLTTPDVLAVPFEKYAANFGKHVLPFTFLSEICIRSFRVFVTGIIDFE